MVLLQDWKNTTLELLAEKLPRETRSAWAKQGEPVKSLKDLCEAVNRCGVVCRDKLLITAILIIIRTALPSE